MEGEEKKSTSKQPGRYRPFTGADGNTFTKDNQPSPELKSNGWKERRAERLLTQAILARMTKGRNLETYITSLVRNARRGNPKAIETINLGIEDDIKRFEITGKDGAPLEQIKSIEIIHTTKPPDE